MGRQIRFHIDQEDANELIDFIYSKGGIIINENGQEADEDDLLHIMDRKHFEGKYKFAYWCIKFPNSNLILNYYKNADAVRLDKFNSEVIEFSLPYIRYEEIPLYDVGRIWCDRSGYENGSFYVKEHEKELMGLYNKINYYIRKNYKLSINKFSYIGKHAYKMYMEGKLIPTVTGFALREEY